MYKCLNLVSNECQTSFLRGQLVNVCVGIYEEKRLTEKSLIVDTIIPILPNYLSALSIVSHRFFYITCFFRILFTMWKSVCLFMRTLTHMLINFVTMKMFKFNVNAQRSTNCFDNFQKQILSWIKFQLKMAWKTRLLKIFLYRDGKTRKELPK